MKNPYLPGGPQRPPEYQLILHEPLTTANAYSHPDYHHGIHLIIEAYYWEAHSVLEALWKLSADPEKKFLQALIQLCAAQLKNTKQPKAFDRLRQSALNNLESLDQNFCGLRLDTLIDHIQSTETQSFDLALFTRDSLEMPILRK